jgi:transcription elongation factor GreA
MYKEAKFKMSEERLQELKDELVYLQTVREKEVAQQIKEARSFGDLTENSEYDEAKTEQGKLYSKIAEIKNLIENAEIIKVTDKTDKVSIGSRVTVLDIEFGEKEIYEIVGSQEADPIQNRVSDDSPFGRGLMERKKGDTVEIDAPTGVLKFKILNIDKQGRAFKPVLEKKG